MMERPNFKNADDLLPTIVQDANSAAVLMLGYMNAEAYERTLKSGRVTFFSRSRNTLWVKGEASGNYLELVATASDCDGDAILVTAKPAGPTCHTGADTCFGTNSLRGISFLTGLTQTIAQRRSAPIPGSYTSELFSAGIDRLVQKVGEEALEVVIEGKNNDNKRLLSESADLLFHLMVLLESRGLSLADVCAVLERRAE